MHPQLKKPCALQLALSSCILTFIYERIVKSSCAFVSLMSFIPVVCQVILFSNDWEKQTPVPHPFLGLGQSSCNPQIKMPIWVLFYSILDYYLLLSRILWELHHLLGTLDVVIHLAIIVHPSVFVLVVTGISTTEPWCVKSILLAMPLFSS